MITHDLLERNFIAAINGGPDLLDQDIFDGPVERVLLGMKAHANTINLARLKNLEDCFPLCRQALGDFAFNGISRRYVDRDAARKLETNDFGIGFPAFLRSENFDDAICDLAAIEWAWLESYHAPEANSLSLQVIAGLDQTKLEVTQVHLHPSLRVVTLAADAHPVLTGCGAAKQGDHVLICRPETEVRLSILNNCLVAFIKIQHDTTTIGNLLQLLDEHSQESDPVALLLTLIGAGALVAAE